MENRFLKIKKLLVKEKLDAILVSSVPAITYLTGFSNFSAIEREAFLFITQNKQYIITDGRYSEAVALHVPHFELLEISTQRSLKTILKELAEKLKIKRIGIEEDNITITEQKMLCSRFNDLPAGKAGLNHFSTKTLRVIKDSSEVAAIKKACVLGDETFEYIIKKITVGISEKQLAFEIEHFIKQHDADISFPPIVAFGKNSSIPHHQTSNQRLASSGQFVLLDFGVKVDNYCSDMTRTIVFGKASDKQKRMYQTVLNAQQKAIEYLDKHLRGGRMDSSEVNSIKASDIDKVAREYIVEQGYSTIPHSLGHGIGIEVHEAPRLSPKSKDTLEPGMVFSVEPGIYVPGFGGVRIEDLVVLKTSGHKLLTTSPKHLIEL